MGRRRTRDWRLSKQNWEPEKQGPTPAKVGEDMARELARVVDAAALQSSKDVCH